MKEFKALSLKTPGRHESPAPCREKDSQFRFLSAYYPTTSLPGFSRDLPSSGSEEAFKKMVESGMDLTNETFAKVLGVSTKTIERWKRRLGIEPKTHKLTEEDKRRIVALYEEGYTQQEIAEMMQIRRESVRDVLSDVNYHNHVNCVEPTFVGSTQTTSLKSSKEVISEARRSEEATSHGEEVIDEDDIEELEREIEEELERESRRVIKVEKRGERLYKVMDEWMTRFSSEYIKT